MARDGVAEADGVLVVEDDCAIRDVVREILESEGFGVRVAAHGADALAVLRASSPRPRVILLDLMMPVMDGWEFRRALKADPELARIPVVVVSADHMLEQKIASLAVEAWLPKPFELDTLLATISRLCLPPPAPPGPAPGLWAV